MRYREFKYAGIKLALNENAMGSKYFDNDDYKAKLDLLFNFLSAYNKIKV